MIQSATYLPRSDRITPGALLCEEKKGTSFFLKLKRYFLPDSTKQPCLPPKTAFPKNKYIPYILNRWLTVSSGLGICEYESCYIYTLVNASLCTSMHHIWEQLSACLRVCVTDTPSHTHTPSYAQDTQSLYWSIFMAQCVSSGFSLANSCQLASHTHTASPCMYSCTPFWGKKLWHLESLFLDSCLSFIFKAINWFLVNFCICIVELHR